ncbi:MAG: hypothetical protein WC871_02405 [Bacteroidales bacterium]|jgi:hypothetical protein
MMPLELTNIYNTFIYVMNGNFFWQAMAMVTIISMMIGSLICNGDLILFKKTSLVVVSYSILMILTTYARLLGNDPDVFARHVQTLAGLVTTILITCFYLFGLFLGIQTHNLARR